MNLSLSRSLARALLAASILGVLAVPAVASAAGVQQRPAAVALAAQQYTYVSFAYSGDTFTQLLGINKSNVIAGYHGSGAKGHPNKGFTLTLPNKVTNENYPGSAQTQVIGINNSGRTVGFYVDSKGVNHAFDKYGTTYKNDDAPGTSLDQNLGINNSNQIAGYSQYGSSAVFHPYVQSKGSFVFPNVTNAQATDINNSGVTSGFKLTNASGSTSEGFLWKSNSSATQYLKYPGSSFTQALGLNDNKQVVGTYNDSKGAGHGFVYNTGTKTYQAINYPGSLSTVVNGINDNGWMVGFYVAKNGNTVGFVAEPKSGTGTTKSTTTLSSPDVSTCPCTHYQKFTFTATVTSGATGTVTLYDQWVSGSYSGTSAVGSASLSGGKATFSGKQFSAGSHHVYATYQGNSKYAKSTSSKLVFTIFVS